MNTFSRSPSSLNTSGSLLFVQVLGKLRYLYTDTASNPFYDPGMPLGDSPKFVKEAGKIASAVPTPRPNTFTV
jgi:hypothetical protein